VLSGGAVTRIASSRLKELVITDTIQPTEAVRGAANIRTLPVATLIAEAIGRTAAEESVSSLFDESRHQPVDDCHLPLKRGGRFVRQHEPGGDQSHPSHHQRCQSLTPPHPPPFSGTENGGGAPQS
jgi:hypothetical protein